MRAPTLFAVLTALAFVGVIRADEPTTAEGYIKRGDEHLAKYDTDKAIADYTRAIELDKKIWEELAARALYLALFTEKREVALKVVEIAFHAGVEHADLFNTRGGIYKLSHKTTQAIADYTSAIRLDPKNTTAYAQRAAVHTEQKEYAKAIIDYTKVIELEPKACTWYSSRADVHAANNDVDAAIADYTSALKLDPNYFLCLYCRGKLHLKKGRLDEAIADETAALKLSPNSSDAYLLRAEAEKRKGNAERATVDFNKAIECSPNIAGIVYLYQLGKLPDILDYGRKLGHEATRAVKNKPDDPDGHICLAAFYGIGFNSIGFNSNAFAHYTTALRLAPERAAPLLVCRGAAYLDCRRYASAVADFREALQLEPGMKLAETLLNAAIAKMTEYKSETTVESVRLDEEVFFVKTSVEKDTLPDGATKTIKKTLTTRHEVTVADVRKLDVEVRSSLRQKQESSSGSTSSSRSSDSTTVGGGGSIGLGIFSFNGRGGHTWESGSESGYSSSTLTGWESEFGTSIRKGMEKSRAFSSSVETSDEVSISPVGKGDDQPFLVIYRDKYRSGTAKLKINGVDDEVRFAFPVGKDITWKYVEKPKPEEKK